jgi:putative endonuclease
MTARLPLGARGERLAARHLRRAGYRILARNLRNRFGEVDLLALDPDGRTIVIVEVKAGSDGAVEPEVHLTRDKQRRLVALAAQVARRYRLTDRPFRFDLVAVDIPHDGKPVIRHHVAAFESHV